MFRHICLNKTSGDSSQPRLHLQRAFYIGCVLRNERSNVIANLCGDLEMLATSSSSIGPALPRSRSKRRWITELRPFAREEVSMPERIITARIRSPFARGPPSEHSSSSSASEQTSLSLLSLSDGGASIFPPSAASLRKENGKEKLRRSRPLSAK